MVAEAAVMVEGAEPPEVVAAQVTFDVWLPGGEAPEAACEGQRVEADAVGVRHHAADLAPLHALRDELREAGPDEENVVAVRQPLRRRRDLHLRAERQGRGGRGGGRKRGGGRDGGGRKQRRLPQERVAPVVAEREQEGPEEPFES